MERRGARRRWLVASGLVFSVGIAALAWMPAVAAAQSAALNDVTFSKDVAPILYDSCVTCHRAGEMAPMALTTYAEVRPWARSIKSHVVTREMPPWHIDRNIGIQKFKNDISLTDEQIATIETWVDNGAPMGDAADMPPMPEFPGSLGVADRRAGSGRALSGLSGAGGGGRPVRLSVCPVSVWRRTATSRRSRRGPWTSGRVRSSTTRSRMPLTRTTTTRQTMARVTRACSWWSTPRARARRSTRRTRVCCCRRTGRPGSAITSTPSVKRCGSASSSASCFIPRAWCPITFRWSKQLARHNTDLDIPGGAVVRQDGYERLNKAARITAFQPHMHIRGKYQCLELIYPTTPIASEVVNCANFDYNWHLVYNYADDVAPLVPAGTILHTISWHDNTEANWANPDAVNWVGKRRPHNR